MSVHYRAVRLKNGFIVLGCFDFTHAEIFDYMMGIGLITHENEILDSDLGFYIVDQRSGFMSKRMESLEYAYDELQYMRITK